MNSAWVGGDEARFPCDSTLPNGATNPLAGQCMLRLSQPKHPERLMVFASARMSPIFTPNWSPVAPNLVLWARTLAWFRKYGVL